MNHRFALASLAIALLATSATAANVSFDFTSSLLYSSGTAVFSGTLTNTGSGIAYINGDNFTLPLPVDDTPFLLDFPPTLPPGESVTGAALIVMVPRGATTGMYVGSFSVLGGDNASSTDVLATRSFAVYVVPEPAAWPPLAASLGALLFGALRANRRRAGD